MGSKFKSGWVHRFGWKKTKREDNFVDDLFYFFLTTRIPTMATAMMTAIAAPTIVIV